MRIFKRHLTETTSCFTVTGNKMSWNFSLPDRLVDTSSGNANLSADGTGQVPDIHSVGATDDDTIIYLSVIFFFVGVVGISGNLLVVFAVVCNKKMRGSMTNLLITNLAVADLIIMVLGVPEIIQFMMNRGWTLDDVTCRVNRYILVTALYASVLTLLSLCVER